jgi:hypothetical protein
MIKQETQVDHSQVVEDFIKKQKDRIKRLKDKCDKKGCS